MLVNLQLNRGLRDGSMKIDVKRVLRISARGLHTHDLPVGSVASLHASACEMGLAKEIHKGWKESGLDRAGGADLDSTDGDFFGEVHGDLLQVELDLVDIAFETGCHRWKRDIQTCPDCACNCFDFRSAIS